MRTFKYLVLSALLFSTSLLAERPNVVLIISDDHAWTDYGFLGNEKIQSPHIDRLADEGLTFTRGYVTTPLKEPLRSSRFLGRPTSSRWCRFASTRHWKLARFREARN